MESVSSAFFGYWIGGELFFIAKQYVGTSFILASILVTEAETCMKRKRETTFG
jgi:hypothetical protein